MTRPTPTQADEVPSRYLVVTAAQYQDRSGRRLAGVYHTATARLFLVDPLTAEVLAGAQRPTELAPETRARLRHQGLLVAADADETEVLRSLPDPESERTRQFVVMPTGYCNLSCDYCGQEHRRGPATLATGRHRAALVARVRHAAASGRYDRIRVRWFGGEPLLDTRCYRTSHYGSWRRPRGTRSTIPPCWSPTGAVDQRKLRNCIYGAGWSRSVTLDGPAATHGGDGGEAWSRTYHWIIAALQQAVSDPDLTGLQVSVPTNVVPQPDGGGAVRRRCARRAGIRGSPSTRPRYIRGDDVPAQAVAARELAEVELAWYRAYQAAVVDLRAAPGGAPPDRVCRR